MALVMILAIGRDARLANASTGNAPTQKELEQLVSPIALYPDTLVAQILAASTHPVDIVEAERFMQEHKDLTGKPLAEAVDKQPWDPSVKSLTQFPPVLANMNDNLSWTSALGDAYFNEPQAVLKEIQVLRKKAQAAQDHSPADRDAEWTDYRHRSRKSAGDLRSAV